MYVQFKRHTCLYTVYLVEVFDDAELTIYIAYFSVQHASLDVISGIRIHQALQEALFFGIVHYGIGIHASFGNGDFQSLVQTAQFVHQAQFFGGTPCPYPALCNFVKLFHADAASVGAAGQEEFVAVVDVHLHQSFFTVIHRSGEVAEVGIRVGFYDVEVQAEFLCQSFGVGHHAKDADRAGQSGGFGNDGVGIAGNVVAAGCCIVAHGHDYRFLFLQLFYGIPYLFGTVGASTRGVDAQHYGFHIFIIFQLAQVSDNLFGDLRKLKDNDDVKAVVLRVNSPGGSAFASEQIWHAVKELKTKKPVIVSMGDYAASGGYYISCVADTIVAEPTTLTGSIGIFGMIPNVKGLTDKIGLSYDVVKTNKYADFGNIMRPFNEDEKSLLQMMITEGYDTFVTRCAEGRHMTKEAIEKIAEGRVWTGETAKELGLVDELGGIDKALDIAVAKVGIEGYTVVSYPEKQDFLSSLLDTKPTNYVESQLLKSKLGEYYQQFGLLKNLQEQSMIQARIPFELNIK